MQQIWQWLHWHSKGRKNRAANRKTLDVLDRLMKGKSRAKWPVEIYSKMYYTSQVKPDNSLDSPAQNICGLRRHIEKKFKDEPQEIRDEVMPVHSEQSSSKNDTSVFEDEDQAHLELDAEARQR